MQLWTSAPNPMPPGLVEAVEAAGVTLTNTPEGWLCGNPAQASSIASGYDPLSYVVAKQLAAAKAAKFGTMFGGYTTSGGIPVQTDAQSLSWLNMLYNTATNNSAASIDFKDRNNTYHTMTAAQFIAFAEEVNSWVQQAISAEKTLIKQITTPNQTWQQVNALAISGFPVNS